VRVDANALTRSCGSGCWVGTHRGLHLTCFPHPTDGFLRVSLPGSRSVTWRLVAVDQRQPGMRFAGVSWLVVGRDGRRFRHVYLDPRTGERRPRWLILTT
jgi:hypothetical protein